MNARRFAIVGVLLGVPALLWALAPPELPKPDFSKATAYKVSRIVDGDTIVVSIDGKETSVRLIGVDTPETVDPRKPVQAFGKEASAFTRNLLAGESVYLEYDQEKQDKYKRTLAYVFRSPDGLFVNLEIIRQGYGNAYTKYPFKGEYMELFRHYEKLAREAKKGLWGDGAAVPTEVKPGDKSGDKPGEKADKASVFITRTGMKYHTGDCRYLAKSKIPISLDDAKKKYGPCSVCNPPK